MSTQPEPVVNKCVCFNITFEEIKAIIDKNNLTSVSELKKFATVAENCKLCLPYIEKIFQTGETKFNLITNSINQNET